MSIYRLGLELPIIKNPDSIWIAPTATVMGKVILEEGVNIWFGAVVRAREKAVIIGKNTSIQDMVIIQANSLPTTIGDNSVISAKAAIYSAKIGSNCIIGAAATIMNGAVIGNNSIVAAGAVVPIGASYPDGSLISGSPAKMERMLGNEELELIKDECNSALEAVSAFKSELEYKWNEQKNNVELAGEYVQHGLMLEKSNHKEEAAFYYNESLKLDPIDTAGAILRLSRLGLVETPQQHPSSYVGALFNSYASDFEETLVDNLGYNSPKLIGKYLKENYELDYFVNFLDLGSGTGLVGEAIKDFTCIKTGVDLADEMISLAKAKGIYDNLFVGSIGEYLVTNEEDTYYDLIVAADVLPYLGDLDSLFHSVSKVLMRGGLFIVTTEKAPDEQPENYKINNGCRYSHRESYLRDTLAKYGLSLQEIQDIPLRKEHGDFLSGQIFFAKKI